MKTMKLTFMAVLMAFAFTACKKDKTTTLAVAPAIEGKWVGSYTPNGQASVVFLFSIKSPNVFEIVDPTDPSKVSSAGTWKLTDGTQFEATVPFGVKTFTYAATFDKASKLTIGTAESSDNADVKIASWSANKW